MTTALGFGYAALIIYLANMASFGAFELRTVRWMLIGLCVLLAVLGLSVFQQSPGSAGFFTGLTVVLGALTGGLFIMDTGTRTRLRQFLPAKAGYNPDSIVHTTAIVLLIFQVLFTLATFQLAGGQAGLAEMMTENPPGINDAVFSAGVYSLLALGGVGFFTRRDLAQSLERLGLRPLTMRSVGVAVGVALAMQAASVIFTLLWIGITPTEVLQQQQAAGNALAAASATSSGLILITALSSSIGEELLFRGALQPIFGLALTTLMFTVVHTQYLGSPALLFILVMGGIFGWIRQRYSTTAAIVAHFVFNLISLQMAALGMS